MPHLSRKLWFGAVSRLVLVLVAGGVLLPLAFQNSTRAACDTVPARAKLVTPANGATVQDARVPLDWQKVHCATHYAVVIRKNVSWGRPMDAGYDLDKTAFRTRRLIRNETYWWRVEACNAVGCSVSKWSQFILSK